MYNIYCNIPATYIIIYAYSFRKYFSIQDDRIMNNILLGNIISFVGSVVMIYVGVLKSKKAILITQGIQCGIMAVSNIVLGGLSGCLTNLITVIRNVYCLKFNYNRPVKIVLIAVQIVLGIIFCKTNIMMWLPLLAGCLFTWCMDSDNIHVLKYIIILAQIMWLLYDFTISNYVGMAFDTAAVVSNFVGILRLRKSNDDSSDNPS